MSIFRRDQLYTQNHLEALAKAMGVATAYLWIDPVNNSLSLKDCARTGLGDEANEVDSEAAVEQTIND